jgi:hemin uptake protein HemP
MDAATTHPPVSPAEAGSSNFTPDRAPQAPCLSSTELFRRTREVLIEHGGAYYRLRLTHSNKLILTK